MKFVFYSDNEYFNFLNLPIKPISDTKNGFYRLGRTDNTASPPVPSNIFSEIPKSKQILYDIFSLDTCIDPSGKISCEKISEEDALSRASVSKIYHDSFSTTAYFRYMDTNGQHTVWLEDTGHTIQKIKKLSELGFDTIGFVINNLSVGTIINLIHTDSGSI